MTPTHIMLTEQGFVAFELPDEYSLSYKEKFISTSVPLAPEEQEKVKQLIFGLVGCPMSFAEWTPEKNVPYSLPDGVEVEIIEVECESICDRACKEYGCDGHTKFAYLKTKEVKELLPDRK